MDSPIPRKIVVAVAFILVVLAGLGVYQGWRRSSLGDAESGEAGLPSLTAPGAAGAKTASALADPSTQYLNEAQVREIARQEARAALGQPRTTAAPASSAGDEAPSPTTKPAATTATAATPAPSRPAPGPALQTPAGPAPQEGGQAPLF